MAILYPWVLWFSTLISIPILIHLFYFRRYKTVLFSNTALLDNVIKKSRSQQRLRNLIILLLRILFILSLVFAFSQPFIVDKKKLDNTVNKIIGIYIDNTFSMTREGEHTSLLDQAKSNAISFIQSMPIHTRYLLYYHGMNESVSKLLSSEEVQKKINAIKTSSDLHTWSYVFDTFKKAQDALHIENKIELAFFTDGQKYAVDYAQWQNMKEQKVYLFYQQGEINSNLCIDSIWIGQPNHVLGNIEQINAKITNYSSNDLNNIPVRLLLNDTLKALATINLKSQQSQEVMFKFTNKTHGWTIGKIEIADFPITFDNHFYFTYPVFSNIKVAIIGGDNIDNFKAFFNSDSSFQASYFSSDNIPYSRLSSFEVIILNQIKNISSGLWTSLKNYASNGGTVIVIPSDTWKKENINSFLGDIGFNIQGVDSHRLSMQINAFEQDFYEGLFSKKDQQAKMPWARNILNVKSIMNTKNDILLQFENGQIALSRVFIDKGKWYLFSFSFDKKNTDFIIHPLFVAIMHRIIQLAIPQTNLYYTLNSDTYIKLNIDTNVSEQGVSIKKNNSQQMFIPMQQQLFNELIIQIKDQDLEDGIYELNNENVVLDYIALNYNRHESDMEFYNSNELIKLLKDRNIETILLKTVESEEIKSTIQYMNNGISLWKWLIGFALIFLFIEMFILRFWKV